MGRKSSVPQDLTEQCCPMYRGSRDPSASTTLITRYLLGSKSLFIHEMFECKWTADTLKNHMLILYFKYDKLKDIVLSENIGDWQFFV